MLQYEIKLITAEEIVFVADFSYESLVISDRYLRCLQSSATFLLDECVEESFVAGILLCVITNGKLEHHILVEVNDR